MSELTVELRTAAETDDIEAIGALIEAGADPNAKNAAGNTALHAAAYWRHRKVCTQNYGSDEERPSFNAVDIQ